MAHTILRVRQVTARTGLPRSSLYARIKIGVFPKPIRLGNRSVGWVESEIDAWVSQQIKLSRTPKV